MPDDRPPDQPDPAPTASGEGGGPSLAARIAQIALTLVVVYLVFFQVLPGVADWDEVGETLRDVSAFEVALIVLISLGIEAIKASEQWRILPRLRLLRAFVALEIASLVGNLVPASTTATRYGVYRSWGFSSSDFARGWLVSSAFNNFIVLVAPVLGPVLGIAYIVAATDTEAPTWLLWATAIAAVAAAVVAVVVIVAFRSEHLAVAAAVLFRAARYALPIVLGLPCALVWKRKTSWRAEPVPAEGIDRAIGAAVGRPLDEG